MVGWGLKTGRSCAGIVLSGELDVLAVAFINSVPSGRDGQEGFEQAGLMGLESGRGRPGFG